MRKSVILKGLKIFGVGIGTVSLIGIAITHGVQIQSFSPILDMFKERTWYWGLLNLSISLLLTVEVFK